MSKPPCRECWDPVDRVDEELCDWCKMTPEERSKRYSRDLWLLALGLVLVVLALAWGLPT